MSAELGCDRVNGRWKFNEKLDVLFLAENTSKYHFLFVVARIRRVENQLPFSIRQTFSYSLFVFQKLNFTFNSRRKDFDELGPIQIYSFDGERNINSLFYGIEPRSSNEYPVFCCWVLETRSAVS